MSNRYSLSQTDSPRTTYRVIDHAFDDEPALHPATLPNGSPHPLAGQPVSVVASPSPAYKVQGEGRVRTWGEIGGHSIARIEQVPAWAAAPASTVRREDPHALDGIPEELLADGGLSVRTWFAVPISWDDVPAGRRPAPDSPLRAVHPHQLTRWQDRYALAAAHAPSARLALQRLSTAL
jgi:hypothetical protein|nr:MAG TPA: hypothetical protein [Caudoviricetes sp.]